MRTREQIMENDYQRHFAVEVLAVEVLLDIRDLLLEFKSSLPSNSLPVIPFSVTQKILELEEALTAIDEIEKLGGDAPHRAVKLADRIRIAAKQAE